VDGIQVFILRAVPISCNVVLNFAIIIEQGFNWTFVLTVHFCMYFRLHESRLSMLSNFIYSLLHFGFMGI